MYAMPLTSPASPTGPTVDLAGYSTPIAFLVALLVLAGQLVKLIATPLALAVLVTDRIGRRLDRWLAALPMPPQPVRFTASRRLAGSLPR